MHRAWAPGGKERCQPPIDAMATASAMLGDQPAPIYAALFMLYRSSKVLMVGDLAAAEEAANVVLLLADRGFDPTMWYGPALMAIRAVQGRMPELIPLMRPASTNRPSVRPTRRPVGGVRPRRPH